MRSLEDKITKAYKRDYRHYIHNEEMERQLNKTVAGEQITPVVEHQLEEPTRLQQVPYDLSSDLSVKDIMNRKIRAIDLIVALASRQEVQTRKPRSFTTYINLPKGESRIPNPSQSQMSSPFSTIGPRAYSVSGSSDCRTANRRVPSAMSHI